MPRYVRYVGVLRITLRNLPFGRSHRFDPDFYVLFIYVDCCCSHVSLRGGRYVTFTFVTFWSPRC